MKRLGALCSVGVLLLSGCGSVPHERAATGAGFGAASGAVAGALISGLSVGAGALIGAGVGALAGAFTRAEDLDLGPPAWRWGSQAAEPGAAAAASPPPMEKLEPAPATTSPATTAAPLRPATFPRSYLVFFEWDSADLTPEAMKVMGLAVANARQGGISRIETTGHADLSGPDAYNMRLSRRRAESVTSDLVRQGIQKDRVAIFWKGETEPLVPTPDGVREPQNRRVEIVFK